MPSPSGTQVHVDSALTDFSVAYFMEDGAFIARKVFPALPVPRQTDVYHVYNQGDLLRTDAQRRAPGTQVALRDFGIADSQYYIPVRAIGHAISEQDAKNADPVINLEEDAVKVCVQDLKIAEEVDFNTVAFGTSAWGTNATPSVKWDLAAAYPLVDIATGIRTVQYNTGRLPNVAAVGAECWYSGLLNHSDIIERLPDNAPRIVTPNFLANLLGLQEVHVATAGYNSSVEGATASYGSILTDSMLLLYRNPNPSRLAPSAGATFIWSGLSGMQDGMRVQREFIPRDDAMPLITVEVAAKAVITSTALGYHLYTTIT